MSPPPMAGWNLGLRFGLEVVALVALGAAAWELAPGVVRLVLELAILGAGVAWLAVAGRSDLAGITAVAIAVQDASSWPRIGWLLAS